VVLQDTAREVPHAVLSVRWAGPDLVLDNLSSEVRLWPELAHYQPIYTVNESGYKIIRSKILPGLLHSAGS
jgi:predicted transglutaminase-like cysteine proteinase